MRPAQIEHFAVSYGEKLIQRWREDAMWFSWGWVNPRIMLVCSSWQLSSHQEELENKTNMEEGGLQDRLAGFSS